MRIGLYIFVALVLGAIIGGSVYTINDGNYLVEVMGIQLNFPVAVWVILPMLLLLIFTAFHMMFYSLKGYFRLKKWEKDAVALEDALYWSLLNEPKEQKYTREQIKSAAVILSKASLEIHDSIDGLNSRLSKVVHLLSKIKNGEYVDLKEHKLAKVLTAGNPYLIQNRLNRLEVDESFVEEVIRSSTQYSKEVQAKALEIFATTASFEKARKYAKVFDAKNFHLMLNRVAMGEEDLELTGEVIDSFVEVLKLGCADFVSIAMVTKKEFSPDQNLALFRRYQNQNPKAQNAYLYLLFEYELLDNVSAYLDEQGEEEFVKFRALYELKKTHKTKFNLEDLIDMDSLCR